jgi:hypothetical protein
VDFIKYYLFDSGMENELPVVVRFAFGDQTVDSLWVNITGLPLVQVDNALAALTDEILLSSSRTTGPRTEGSVTSTK